MIMSLPQGPGTAMASGVSLAIAGLVGLAVGFEREWSGHASGPQAHFAGVRTFLLLGLLSGAAGLLLTWDYNAVATVMLAGAALFIAFAYQAAVQRDKEDVDGTTEAAAFVVLALGVLAGLGQHALAGGAVALVVLALGLKKQLHNVVRHIGETEMRAAVQFSVLALVVLPLLPAGPFESLGGLRPRSLWLIVLLIAGLNFAGYVARRTVGASRGYALLGMIGGVVSSTAVTFQFARQSKDDGEHGGALARGVLAACTVLTVRVAAVAAALSVPVARALWPYLLPPLLAGAAIILLSLRAPNHEPSATPDVKNPLRLGEALRLAAVFQVAIIIVDLVSRHWGTGGVIASSIALGTTDVDALTVAMSRLSGTAGVALAAEGIGIGILTNTVVKTGLALGLGRGAFRRWAVLGLLILTLASAFGLWLGRILPTP
jgi:uncharacterized membrane protein (DUF4010 family)